MKINKIQKSLAVAFSAAALFNTSCVDDVKFGDSFLEKASGGDVTADTVFSNVTYVTQYLNALYSMQYYGLPYRNEYSQGQYPWQESSDLYTGKPAMLTDCWVTNSTMMGLANSYLTGSHSAIDGERTDKFSYLNNRVWSSIRYAMVLIENIDKVPGMSDELKKSYIAQAKAVMASRCFDIFRHYGGVPIVKTAYTGSEANFGQTRASVEEYVNYMVDLLDEAAADLPWTLSNPSADLGRFTKAGAMGLKCKILAFAASPIFNDDEPFHPDAANNKSVWYGNFDQARWTRCLKACEEFFEMLNTNGGYHLQEAADNSNCGTIRPEDYRLAYRLAYAELESPEILHTVRHIGSDAFKSGYYSWHNWNTYTQDGEMPYRVDRAYYPSQEYVEMFCWKDGKNFSWEEAEENDKNDRSQDHTLQKMFGIMELSGKNPGHYNLTRDPRLYEEVMVNSVNRNLDWTTGNMSGVNIEVWVGSTHAGQSSVNQQGAFASGYGLQKWIMGEDYLRKQTQWITLRLPDLYYTYAEALAQTGNLTKAIEQIDIVRARVGLPGIAVSNPELNLESDKDALIEEILRERVCELGMEDTRWFDIVRYKKGKILEKPLHALNTYWIKSGKRATDPWYDGNKLKRGAYPTEFEYEKVEWFQLPRYWWTNGFDPKWYLSPIPQTEINKNYGLVQNPGW